MNLSKYRIETDQLTKAVNFLIEHFAFEYENHSKDMTVLSMEEYYFRNNSTQLNMIIVKWEGDYLLFDVIGGAGGSGIFNINFGSEQEFIRKVERVLNALASEFNQVLDKL